MTQPLPTAVLGRTGLEVTRLGYGAGHRKPMNDRQRETILNAVLDGGGGQLHRHGGVLWQ